MKREILFRGKTINGDWVYGNLAVVKKDFTTVKKGHYISNPAGSSFAYLVRPDTVGQFTGLLDCKGNRIFEGDILKINTAVCVGDFFEGNDEDVPQEIICEVVYRTENASFDLDTLERDTHLTGWGFYDGEGYTMEITGNIHETNKK